VNEFVIVVKSFFCMICRMVKRVKSAHKEVKTMSKKTTAKAAPTTKDDDAEQCGNCSMIRSPNEGISCDYCHAHCCYECYCMQNLTVNRTFAEKIKGFKRKFKLPSKFKTYNEWSAAVMGANAVNIDHTSNEDKAICDKCAERMPHLCTE